MDAYDNPIDVMAQIPRLSGVKTAKVDSPGQSQEPSTGATVEELESETRVQMSHSSYGLARLAERLKAVGLMEEADFRSRQDSPPTGFQKDSEGGNSVEPEGRGGSVQEKGSNGDKPSKTAGPSPENKDLSSEDEAQVEEMQAIDKRVRAHEMAHKAAAGSLASGGPYYTYETGPDGRSYASGGHVPIHLPKTDKPEVALRQSQQAYRAALAPADPSPVDRALAQEFFARAAEARQMITERRREESQSDPSTKKKDRPSLLKSRSDSVTEKWEDGSDRSANDSKDDGVNKNSAFQSTTETFGGD